MLIQFSVENYLSFKEKQTLSMAPDPLKERKDYLQIPYLYDIDIRVLKSIAIYGHNSHGKSNFIKAYKFLKDFILSSFSFNSTGGSINIECFKLNSSSVNQPSSFEIVFYLKQTKFRYGFKATNEKILEEWLYQADPKIRENNLFYRVEQEIRISKTWNKDSNNRIEQSVPFSRPSVLFLSILISQIDITRCREIAEWLQGNIILIDLKDEIHIKTAVYLLYQPHYREMINRFIEKADLGFHTIFERIDSNINKKISLEKGFLNLYFAREIEEFEIYTKHSIFDDSFKLVDSHLFELLKNESAGTIKYLILSCYLAYAIKRGQLIWIDEIDSSFHSLLLRTLIDLYNNPKINTNGSQLVFTTHSTVLLHKCLRRDQIVFVEKNIYGVSSLRKMHSSSNPIRIDTLIEKEYLKGTLGGVSEKLRNDSEQSKLDFD